ncbi:MAG: hypothetical protein OIF47_11175 [Marinibacterium sp.]|nr:hypothetical protein [Marinibacterium sp.]
MTYFTPYDLMRLGWAGACLTADSQQVIAMRMLGFGGYWPVAKDEGQRMVNEKASAFTEAVLTNFYLTLSGDAPGRIASETFAPLSRAARDNRIRLSGRLMETTGPALSEHRVARNGASS